MIQNVSQHIGQQKGPAAADRIRLKNACAEFEAVFINYLLKTMRSSVTGGGILGESEAGKLFKSMLDEKMAQEIASGGGLGIGDMLSEQLKEVDS